MEQGKFRLDLYYRLNVIRVMLPPLRRRAQDVLPLAKHFIRHYNTKFRRNILGISSSATMELLNYDWPGNVRELRNTIERAVLLEECDWIQRQSLGLKGGFVGDSTVPNADVADQATSTYTLEQAARHMLLQALEKTGWNQTRAAVVLGITRDTLRYKVKKYNLARPIVLADDAPLAGDDARHMLQQVGRNIGTNHSRTRTLFAETA